MQNTIEERQVRAIQAQHKRPYGVRVLAGFLGIQGVAAFVTNMVGFVPLYARNPSFVLSIGFLFLNVSIFLLLLAWGLWTFKRWAYWVTLLVEGLLLLQNILLIVLTPGSLEIYTSAFSGAFLSLGVILYLVASPGGRAAFFRGKKLLSENERSGINPHVFE